MPAALELQDVSKRFGPLRALDRCDLAIPAGRTTAVIGPSGCGKSTLLRSMLGLEEPDEGAVLFEGEPVAGPGVLEVRRRMGYVIQEGGLFPHLTVRGNAALLARRLGLAASWIASRVEELRELLRLPPDCLGRYPAQLSGGQRQRVSLMRALMLDPSVLLLDEPLGSLDPMIRRDLQNDLREIFRSLGKTVVMVTHDIAEAGHLADSIAVMRRGRILQRGTLPELVRAPADPFVASFINAQRSPLESLAPEGA